MELAIGKLTLMETNATRSLKANIEQALEDDIKLF
jgi:hypothetical protein